MDTLEIPVVDTDEIPVTHASVPPRTHRSAPADRPPVTARMFVALMGFGVMLATAALLLSDRAPGALRAVFGERARQLWNRIDRSERARFLEGVDLPRSDFIVHAAIFAVLMTFVGLAVWSWRGLMVGAVSVVAFGGLLELAQGRYSDTRAVDPRDFVANTIGVSVAVVAVACCYGAWSSGAALVRRLRAE